MEPGTAGRLKMCPPMGARMSFIKKAGTILLSTIRLFLSRFGSGGRPDVGGGTTGSPMLAAVGSAVAWICAPGLGNGRRSGFRHGPIARRIVDDGHPVRRDGNVCEHGGGLHGCNRVLLVFNLLCGSVAIGAIKRNEQRRLTWFAILYQCGFAHAVALMVNQFGGLFTETERRGRGSCRFVRHDYMLSSEVS